jgi:hypothetical protein
LWVVKQNSLINYDLYIGNLLRAFKKLIKIEAGKTLAIEDQDIM